MEKLLGANWKTTLWGTIFALAAAIAATPTLIEFLPDQWEPTVRGIAGLIVAASGIGLAINVKDKNVTGGTVQQTSTGAVASDASQDKSSSIIQTSQAAPKT